MSASYPYRVFPSLPQQRMAAENNPMLRGASPSLSLRQPRGQRIPAAQLVMEEEMRQAQGKTRKRR
ncbi:MAG: hypothetical protein M0027_01685 [Candidatus Dormibacteraeota bacterium]|nr:hypothetical protein [Candidatus Dormibacteraeota bacterium]